ncbi:MAG: flagellar assembly peptidoglycan hydrolase FlgJ [Vibrionaceae bacterium]
MKSPTDMGFVHDINQLDKIRQLSNTKDNKEQALKAVASQFEALFTQMLFKSMRDANAAFESDLIDSRTSKFYQQLADEQLSSALSSRGSLGLADMIVKQFQSLQDAKPMDDPSLGEKNSDPDKVQPIFGKKTVLAPENLPKESNDAKLPALSKTVFDVEQLNAILPPLAASAQHSEEIVPPLAAKQPVSQRFDKPQDFVDSLLPHAKKAARALGVDPAILLAQAALETGWGKKVIAKGEGSSHNLFNIKADPRWQGEKVTTQTLEVYSGIPVHERAAFRAYDSHEQSFDDYVDFLNNNPRYANALSQTQQPELFIRGLHQAGYATDPLYEQKVLSVFNKIKTML